MAPDFINTVQFGRLINNENLDRFSFFLNSILYRGHVKWNRFFSKTDLLFTFMSSFVLFLQYLTKYSWPTDCILSGLLGYQLLPTKNFFHLGEEGRRIDYKYLFGRNP